MTSSGELARLEPLAAARRMAVEHLGLAGSPQLEAAVVVLEQLIKELRDHRLGATDLVELIRSGDFNEVTLAAAQQAKLQ